MIGRLEGILTSRLIAVEDRDVHEGDKTIRVRGGLDEANTSRQGITIGVVLAIGGEEVILSTVMSNQTEDNSRNWSRSIGLDLGELETSGSGVSLGVILMALESSEAASFWSAPRIVSEVVIGTGHSRGNRHVQDDIAGACRETQRGTSKVVEEVPRHIVDTSVSRSSRGEQITRVPRKTCRSGGGLADGVLGASSQIDGPRRTGVVHIREGDSAWICGTEGTRQTIRDPDTVVALSDIAEIETSVRISVARTSDTIEAVRQLVVDGIADPDTVGVRVAVDVRHALDERVVVDVLREHMQMVDIAIGMGGAVNVGRTIRQVEDRVLGMLVVSLERGVDLVQHIVMMASRDGGTARDEVIAGIVRPSPAVDHTVGTSTAVSHKFISAGSVFPGTVAVVILEVLRRIASRCLNLGKGKDNTLSRSGGGRNLRRILRGTGGSRLAFLIGKVLGDGQLRGDAAVKLTSVKIIICAIGRRVRRGGKCQTGEQRGGRGNARERLTRERLETSHRNFFLS